MLHVQLIGHAMPLVYWYIGILVYLWFVKGIQLCQSPFAYSWVNYYRVKNFDPKWFRSYLVSHQRNVKVGSLNIESYHRNNPHGSPKDLFWASYCYFYLVIFPKQSTLAGQYYFPYTINHLNEDDFIRTGWTNNRNHKQDESISL